MIRLENVSKVFGTGVAGLSDISLFVERGEFVFLVGHTGSGKTTLLRLLVRDMLPTQGIIVVSDLDVVKLPDSKIPHLRKKVGVIFQDLKLLADRTIIENISLPMQIAGAKIEEGIKRAEELLAMVGLTEHRDKFPIQLSGGELQRVAIARALALSPEVLLADEPTGNLDPQTALEIVQLLDKINQMGTTIIMATHNLDIVEKMKKRVVGLDKGKLVKDEKTAVTKHTDKSTENTEKKEPKESKKGHQKIVDTENTERSTETQKKDSVSSVDDSVHSVHARETRKLSDLLAKARQTLQRHDEKKDMPFGFEKNEDIKK